MNKYLSELRIAISEQKKELCNYISHYDTPPIREWLDSNLHWGSDYTSVQYNSIQTMILEDLIEFANNISNAIDYIVCNARFDSCYE